jgi:subfamily B ATP-binding cassette protein MsbA
VDVRDMSLHDLRQNIAVVFQDNFLFDGTIRENILLGKPEASDEEVAQALERACLTDFIASLENGVDTYIGERGTLLSGGQKQRVSIARAFLKNAPIVILDESVSNLDAENELYMQHILAEQLKDKTVVMIAHRLSTILSADRIIVLEDGRPVDIGTHEELNSRCETYRNLIKNQMND